MLSASIISNAIFHAIERSRVRESNVRCSLPITYRIGSRTFFYTGLFLRDHQVTFFDKLSIR